jgi:hypothetical protein
MMTDEQRQQRIHYHMYETCEGIAEHAERIVALEELCADMHRCIESNDDCDLCGGPIVERCLYPTFERRMDELDIPH